MVIAFYYTYFFWSSSSWSSSWLVNFRFNLELLAHNELSSSSFVVEDTTTLERSESSLNFTTGWAMDDELVDDELLKWSLDWRSAERLDLWWTEAVEESVAVRVAGSLERFSFSSLKLPIKNLASSNRFFVTYDCGESSKVCPSSDVCTSNSFLAASSSF